MRTGLLFNLLLVLGASAAFAQTNGSIGIFADNQGNSYNLPGSSGTNYYYFLHVNAIGATGSQWAAPHPACMVGSRLADMPVFSVNLGNTEAGVTIGYGTCRTGTFHIMTTLYYVTSATECCFWRVVPDPYVESGRIEIPDCDFNLTYGAGYTGVINANATCEGNVDDTSWGRLKAVYE